MAWWEAEGRYYGTQITEPVDNYVAGYVLLGIRLAVIFGQIGRQDGLQHDT